MSNNKNCVIFDIGHGRDTYKRTGGKGVPGLEEFDFNQATVKYAKELAEFNGIEVVLTQSFDSKEVILNNRTKYGNKTKATILISYHADAHSNKNMRGHWVFYWYNSNESKQLAIIWDKYASQIMSNPKKSIQPSIKNTWSDFHILRESKQIAILCEHGFMTNSEDLKLLKSDEFRKQCAEVSVRTCCEWFGIEFKKPEVKEKEIKKIETIISSISTNDSNININNTSTNINNNINISKQEMNNMICKDESNISNYAKDAVQKIMELKLMVGDENGNFNPKCSMTREEFAVVIIRLLKYFEDKFKVNQ